MTILGKNRLHNYAVKETFLAGLVLLGWEVKGFMSRDFDLAAARVDVRNLPVLLGCHVKNKIAHFTDTNPIRERKLLLNKSEIRKLREFIQKGLVLLPLEVRHDKKIKLVIGVCQKIKKADKREAEIKKMHKKEMEKVA
jgi:SsrA-binding protein